MPVKVAILDADVYYRAATTGSTPSSSHDFFTSVHQAPPSWGLADAGPVVAFQLSQKHSLPGQARQWLTLDDAAFVRFKNGGKRLPSGAPAGNTTKTVGAVARDRGNRERKPILEGDVGPYRRGTGNLYKEKLAPATSVRPAHWTPKHPPEYQTDPAAHVQQQQNRDHQNNQAALKSRGANPADATAIAIPQWIHMNGYTFGSKAKPGRLKSVAKATAVGQSRTAWIAANPSPALFKEIYHTIRLYHLSGQLSYEIVGSFRYLYKMNVANLGYTATRDLDNLLMHYLGLAT